MNPKATASKAGTTNRYRLPGIEREGVAQLSLLETALWPLQGGERPGGMFQTTYEYSTSAGRHVAEVTVRAPAGMVPFDEYVLWGLLGASLRSDAELLASPHWMLRMLGLDIGGAQYGQLQNSLLRLAATSYQNTAFYNPASKEHEVAAFQFFSVLLPTVGGLGNEVDNDRYWRIVWNPVFFAYCQSTGGKLLFDLDLYRELSPAARRLFLKLKDRFWRAKRVFFNVDDLTINGLGYSPRRGMHKRKHDLADCLRELLAREIIAPPPAPSDVNALFLKRGPGRYTLAVEEGAYFRAPATAPASRSLRGLAEDPLVEPLLQIGVDAAGVKRLLTTCDRGAIRRWVRVTDAAMHEKPRSFPGFKSSPAAFLVDGVQHRRQAPDWYFAHEKLQRLRQEDAERVPSNQDDDVLQAVYVAERQTALGAYVAGPEAQRRFAETFPILLELYKRTDPNGCRESAKTAAWRRIEELDFRFPAFDEWIAQRRGL